MVLQTFLAVVGMGAIVASLLSVLILRLTLTRRLKKDLQPPGSYWDSGTLDFGFLNTYLFAWACILPYMQRSDFFRGIYQELNVREYANWFERGLCYLTIGGLFVFLAFGVVFIVVEP